MALTREMKVRLFFPLIGIIAGITAGLCFAILFRNWSATAMAFISSIAAVNLLFVHRMHINGTILMFSETKIKLIFVINCVLCTVSFIGLIVCLTLAIIWHQNITYEGLRNGSLWITSVWFFMTSKWLMLSTWYIRRYSSQEYMERLQS